MFFVFTWRAVIGELLFYLKCCCYMGKCYLGKLLYGEMLLGGVLIWLNVMWRDVTEPGVQLWVS